MITDPLSEMNRWAIALRTAGVRCVTDPQDVNPPAVLIRPPTLSFRFGRGFQNATWEAWYFIPDAGTDNALRQGFADLATITFILGNMGVAIVTATPDDFALADGGTVPGFRLTWNT